MRNIQTIAALVGMLLLATISSGAGGVPGVHASRKSVLTYIGTYTGGEAKGIYATRFERENGSFSAPVLAAEVVNPTFLAVHPNARWLYAVNETDSFDR